MAESPEAMALLADARKVIIGLHADLKEAGRDPVGIHWTLECLGERRTVERWTDAHDDFLACHEIEAAKARRQEVTP